MSLSFLNSAPNPNEWNVFRLDQVHTLLSLASASVCVIPIATWFVSSATCNITNGVSSAEASYINAVCSSEAGANSTHPIILIGVQAFLLYFVHAFYGIVDCGAIELIRNISSVETLISNTVNQWEKDEAESAKNFRRLEYSSSQDFKNLFKRAIVFNEQRSVNTPRQVVMIFEEQNEKQNEERPLLSPENNVVDSQIPVQIEEKNEKHPLLSPENNVVESQIDFLPRQILYRFGVLYHTARSRPTFDESSTFDEWFKAFDESLKALTDLCLDIVATANLSVSRSSLLRNNLMDSKIPYSSLYWKCALIHCVISLASILIISVLYVVKELFVSTEFICSATTNLTCVYSGAMSLNISIVLNFILLILLSVISSLRLLYPREEDLFINQILKDRFPETMHRFHSMQMRLEIWTYQKFVQDLKGPAFRLRYVMAEG